MGTPSPGYAVTVRVDTPSSTGATGSLVAAVAAAGGAVTALDVVESHANRPRGPVESIARAELKTREERTQ